MDKDITKFSPSLLWEHFSKICTIPHPSTKEDALRDYIKKFAEEKGLKTSSDETGNILIQKPAIPGMENKKGVVLQAHLDMVPQKNSDKKFNFEKDAIEPIASDGWVKANGTTLGADNGIGVASILSVIESENISHGPLEALFTVDEETGMTGAFQLKKEMLKGEILLNTDTEEEGELCIGCAGGINSTGTVPIKRIKTPKSNIAFDIKLTGLKGGHSGMDIILGRGNSNKLLNRILRNIAQYTSLSLFNFNGGTVRNAIPRESFASFVIPEGKEKELKSLIQKEMEIIKKEYNKTEPSINIIIEDCETPDTILSSESQKIFFNTLSALPNGINNLIPDMPDVVETSSNIAIVELKETHFKVLSLLRSASDSAKEELLHSFDSIFQLAGGKSDNDSNYPGWQPNFNSPLLSVMQNNYKKLFGTNPQVKVVHAGLECGIIGAKYPGLDMISFGPTIKYPHSPDEKVNIESVNKYWELLLETLKNIPEK